MKTVLPRPWAVAASCTAQRLRLGVSSQEAVKGCGCGNKEASTGLGCAHVAICAAAGTTWLLQLIEDMQQSRAFHETCELELPKGQAAKIPEVRSSYWYT